jgi:broad specificity phosphatase PhoE
MALEPTLVTVLRHGEVAGRAHVYRGALDDPMTEAGAARVRAVADRLARPAYDRIATSPRIRCLDFAAAYARLRECPLDVLDAMAEMRFGHWEGMTPAEAAMFDPIQHELFRASAGKVPPPAGESIADLRGRVRQGWENWLADARGGHRLLVTHAGVMRALFMDLVGLDPAHAYRIALPEAAHFQVSILAGEAPVLLNLNSCAD